MNLFPPLHSSFEQNNRCAQMLLVITIVWFCHIHSTHISVSPIAPSFSLSFFPKKPKVFWTQKWLKLNAVVLKWLYNGRQVVIMIAYNSELHGSNNMQNYTT